MAHDETETIVIGDTVRIEACRPLSKNKNFTVAEIIKPAKRFIDPMTGKLYTELQREAVGEDDKAVQGLKAGMKIVGGENGVWRFANPEEETSFGEVIYRKTDL